MKIREWVSLFLIFGFLGYNVIIAKGSESRAKATLIKNPEPKELKIQILGAVERPGIYTCAPGTSLKELLLKANVKPVANKGKIAYKKILLSSQTIEIPEKIQKVSQREKISLVEN